MTELVIAYFKKWHMGQCMLEAVIGKRAGQMIADGWTQITEAEFRQRMNAFREGTKAK